MEFRLTLPQLRRVFEGITTGHDHDAASAATTVAISEGIVECHKMLPRKLIEMQ